MRLNNDSELARFPPFFELNGSHYLLVYIFIHKKLVHVIWGVLVKIVLLWGVMLYGACAWFGDKDTF